MNAWPRMLKRTRAAEYCDLSVAAFEREICAGRLPAPVMLGGREHWCKNALDSRRLQKMASLESIEGKTAINPSNGIVGDGETIAVRVEHHADASYRAGEVG